MNVHFKIEAAEWEFEEELPFEILKCNDESMDFPLPLYDKDGNVTEEVILPNCRVIELVGEEDSFMVIIEQDLIKEQNIYDIEDDRDYNFVFHVDRKLWQQGEDLGIFYSWDNLPEALKEKKIIK